MGTSIIILTYNKLEYTKKCISSIREYTNKENYEIIVVDNNSSDNTREWLKNQGDIEYIFNKDNVGFPAGCNIGINKSKKDNDILLLNNDTIVTTNYLENLKRCLYSDKNIGAVGPVSNSCPYYQNIEADYKDEKELHSFAKKYNISDSSRWEERQKLIGFCMLIKRQALEKTGILDERFSPGNYEDDDYSIRLLNSGYKLYLCKDAFVHHFGSISFSNNKRFSELLNKNEKQFKDKWGFTSREDMNIYKNYEKLIKKENPKILELFCGTGSTGMYVKQYKKCEYYGYDTNKKALAFAIKNLKAYSADNSNLIFDYIIISKVNEFLKDDYIRESISLHINKDTEFILNLSEDEKTEENIKNIFTFDKYSSYDLADGIKEINDNNKMLNRYYL